jgi:hypothetical protein
MRFVPENIVQNALFGGEQIGPRTHRITQDASRFEVACTPDDAGGSPEAKRQAHQGPFISATRAWGNRGVWYPARPYDADRPRFVAFCNTSPRSRIVLRAWHAEQRHAPLLMSYRSPP